MLGLLVLQFLGAVVEETVELPLFQSLSLAQTSENCAGPAVAVLLRGRCPCCAGSSSRPVLDKVVDMPFVVQRQGFSQWRCHRYSSSPVYVDIQLCNTDGYDVSSNFACSGDDGLFDAFCVIFRAPPAMPELSASFSSPRR